MKVWHAALQAASWTCVAVLAALSLLPADEIVRTNVGGQVEHAVAYAGTAAMLRLGYPRQRLLGQMLALIAYAATLEYLQHYSPGRTPAVADWLASSIGAVAGILVGACLLNVTAARWRASRS